MSGIKDYSTTPANNNASPPNGFPEGMAPASLNDGMRQVMADIRSWYEDPAWIDYGDTPTQTGASTFTVSGDRTSRYTAGTRIKMTGTTPFTLFGTISTSSYSAPNTTVTVRMDSGSLDSTLNTVSINKVLQVSQTFLDGTMSILNTSDLSKKALLSVSGLSTGVTKTFTFPDKNGTFAMTDDIPAAPPSAASQAEQETGSATNVYVSPARQQFHASAAKFWGKADAAGTLNASYNVTSITDDGPGQLTVTIATDFSSANWGCWVTVERGSGAVSSSANLIFASIKNSSQLAGAVSFECVNFSGYADPTRWHFGGFGDQ